MKARRDRLPVIPALAWCALINYALQREARERGKKNPERQTSFLFLLALIILCLSSEVAVDLKASDPRFSSHFLFFSSLPLLCPHLSADSLIKEAWNQISSLLVNPMWIFLSLCFSHSSPSANPHTDLIAPWFYFTASANEHWVHPNLICFSLFTLPITECSDPEGPGFLMQLHESFVQNEGNKNSMSLF